MSNYKHNLSNNTSQDRFDIGLYLCRVLTYFPLFVVYMLYQSNSTNLHTNKHKVFDCKTSNLSPLLNHIQHFESSEADVAEQSPVAADSTSGAVLSPADAATAALEAYFIGGLVAGNAAMDAAFGCWQR